MNALITALIPYAVPAALIVIGYFYHLLVVHIPAQQRLYFSQFVNNGVLLVEQQYKDKTSEEKKAIAVQAVKSLYKSFHLPAPEDSVISLAIETAVNFIKNNPVVAQPATVVPAPATVVNSVDPNMAIEPVKPLGPTA